MSRKIAIIGAGADAVAAVVQCVAFRDTMDSVYQDDEIVWIRDCSHKVENYGTQCNTIWVTAMATNTTINAIDYRQRFDGTKKLGMKFIGFGNRKDKNFYVLFDPTEVGLHIDEGKFVEFFWSHYKNQAFNLSLIDKRVESIDIRDDGTYLDGDKFDFVIDCVRGGLWDKESYKESHFNPTNTSLIINRRIPGEWNYTAHIACEHGYLTAIPTSDSQTWVYSYDKDLTSEKQAVADFGAHCQLKKHCTYKKKQYDNKISEYCIHKNNRYARSGRALGFNDELLGMNSYLETDMSEAIAQYLFEDPDRPRSNYHRLEVEDRWRDAGIDYAATLSYYTQFGSKYKSKFWEQTRIAACNLLEDRDLHCVDRNEVYEKLEEIPKHENIRLDYFRRQAEDNESLRQRMTDNSA